MFPQPRGCRFLHAELCFFCLVVANLKKKKTLQSIKMLHCLCDQMYTPITGLVSPVFLEVTLKDYPHVVFPRGFSKLFLKIFNTGDSDLLQALQCLTIQ